MLAILCKMLQIIIIEHAKIGRQKAIINLSRNDTYNDNKYFKLLRARIFYFIPPHLMSKKKQKANFILPQIKKNHLYPNYAFSSVISDSYPRSITEPITDILKNCAKKNKRKDQSMFSSKEKVQIKKEEVKQKQQKMTSQNRRDSFRGSNNKSNDSKQSKNSIELMLYRKSIKHLIEAFQEKSKQMKRLNRNCYYSPKQPKQNGNHISFHEDQLYENPCEKRRKSKIIEVKRKLRKGLLKTQVSESTQIRSINRTELRRAIKINNPFSQQKIIELDHQNIKKKAIIAYPLQREVSEGIEASNKLQKLIKDGHRSKRTTIGGWKFDKFETNYLI